MFNSEKLKVRVTNKCKKMNGKKKVKIGIISVS